MSISMRSASEITFGTFGHPLYQLNDSVQRLREEHVLLEAGLGEIHRMAKAIGAKDLTVNWAGSLKYLAAMTFLFWRDLEAHAKWETETMFPMIAWYMGEELDEFTLMEQEFELAQHFIEAFLDAIRSTHNRPVFRKEAMEMASYLLEACDILKELMRREDGLLFALQDRSNEYGY